MEYGVLGSRPQHGAGSRLVTRFIDQFQSEFRDRVTKYGRYRLSHQDDDGFDQIVAYGEQQVKTSVTAALDAICDSNLMQECPVDRKKPVSRRRVAASKGKVDYWCKYGDGSPVEVLLEVKHGWVRYHRADRYTVHAWAARRHGEAVEQLKGIRNRAELADYAVALTILTLNHLTTDQAVVPQFDTSSLADVVGDAVEKTGANRGWGFALPPEQRRAVFSYKDEEGVRHYETYPAVVLVWSVIKVRRG